MVFRRLMYFKYKHSDQLKIKRYAVGMLIISMLNKYINFGQRNFKKRIIMREKIHFIMINGQFIKKTHPK